MAATHQSPTDQGRTYPSLSHGLLRTMSSYSVHHILLLVAILCAQIGPSLMLDPPEFVPSDMLTFQDQTTPTMYYRSLVVDEDRGAVYVGALEYLYKLQASDISQNSLKSGILKPFNASILACTYKRGNEIFECRNHIRAIIPQANNTLYLCGTGSYDPMDIYVDATTLTLTKPSIKSSGQAKCPYGPDDMATCVYVADGNPGNLPGFYSGTYADNESKDPIIYRSDLFEPGQTRATYPYLRTVTSDSVWLNEPEFVGSFDIGDYVYFFFRELAVEYTNCGRAIYARVARVCKKDLGGGVSLRGMFTTFIKARLNCSLGGDYPFYFNEIYDVYRSEDTFFGVFTTSNEGFYGSAVCEFTLPQIETTFQGQFKGREDIHYNWMPVLESKIPQPRPGQCFNNVPTNTLSAEVLSFVRTHQMVDKAVSSQGETPVYYERDIVFQRMVADTVQHGSNAYNVFFLATDKGRVYKVSWWRKDGVYQSKVLAIWQPFGTESVQIWAMKLFNNYIYLSTDQKVVQLGTAQCQQYKSCTDCIRDPYCGWSTSSKSCQIYIAGGPNQLQDVQGTNGGCHPHCTVGGLSTTSVRVPGDPVSLSCESLCKTEGGVSWHHSSTEITIDNRKYFMTSDNMLVIFNVTHSDEGRYECKDGATLLAHHQVNLPECQDKECLWQEEFRKWCSAFDVYQKQFNHWICLKGECTTNNNCIDSDAVNNCPAPNLLP